MKYIHMDKLSLLKQFVAVEEQGGFSAAANHLGLSPSTLSKAMARLEGSLRIKLLHRSTRQVQLTDAGVRYLSTARSVINALEVCEQQLQQDNEIAKGLIKVNVPVSYGRLYVVPLLQGFIQQYPEIELELSFNDAYVDMLEQGIDLSIRTGALHDQTVVARKLSPIDFLICASPDYIKRYGRPKNTQEFSQHTWIRYRFRQTGRLMPIMTADEQLHDPGRQFVVDDGEALAELCAHSLGITQLPHFIARDWINKGHIQPLFPYYRREQEGIYAVYPKREYLPAKVRALVEYLIQKNEENGEGPYHSWSETLDARCQ